MNAMMISKARRGSKLLGAHAALVGTFAGVVTHVRVQVLARETVTHGHAVLVSVKLWTLLISIYI